MKQKIYIPGIISFVLAILGTLFKSMHYPGAAILLTLGFAGLVLIFFPLGLIDSYRGKADRGLKPLYIVTYITLFVIFTSMLFKILHWPMAGIMLLVSLPFPFIVFLPVFLVTTNRRDDFNIYDTVSVLLLLSFVSVFNGLLALDVTKERVDDSYYLASLFTNHTPEAAGRNIDAKRYDEIEKSTDNVIEVIGEIREKILYLSDTDLESFKADPSDISSKQSRVKINMALFEGPKPVLVDRLEQALSDFVGAIENAGDEDITAVIAGEILGFRTPGGESLSWNQLFFNTGWTSWSLVYLGMLEENVIMLRNDIIADAL